MLTLPVGFVIVAVGGWFVGFGMSWTNFATDGTPLASPGVPGRKLVKSRGSGERCVRGVAASPQAVDGRHA